MATLFTGSILRLAVTAGTLAAVYFFIVKPVLDTTERTIDRSFDSASGIQREINRSLEDSGVNKITVPKNSLKRAEKMLGCINKADGDVGKISACSSKFR